MNGGPTIHGRRSAFEKSNTELINSLRANFTSAQQSTVHTKPTPNESDPSQNGCAPSPATSPLPPWTSLECDTLYIPRLDFSSSGLCEPRSQYDITVKLFFLPSTRTAPASVPMSHVWSALELVLEELHAPSVDLLIISFPGISFSASDSDSESSSPSPPSSSGLPLSSPNTTESDPTKAEGGEDEEEEEESVRLDSFSTTWSALEDLHAAGLVRQLGLAEFGTERLKRFLPRCKRVRPTVDQINVRDCCVVPRELIMFAKQEKIELLTHNDCTDILPGGTIRELLEGIEGKKEEARVGEGQRGLVLGGDIEPQWVVKYTAVVRDRGVIENKGYFAMAEIEDPKSNNGGV